MNKPVRESAPIAQGGDRATQPGAPSGPPATAADLSLALQDHVRDVELSRTAIGVGLHELARLGRLAFDFHPVIVSALEAYSRERAAGFHVPFGWGLPAPERAALRALMELDHVDTERMRAVLGGRDPQRPRKAIHRLRQLFARLDPQIQIVTVTGQGHALTADAKHRVHNLTLAA